MNDTASSPLADLLPGGADLLTTVNLAIIAVLAVLTVIAILYGARLKRQRDAAAREIDEYNEELEADSATPAPPPQAAPTPAPPPPSSEGPAEPPVSRETPATAETAPAERDAAVTASPSDDDPATWPVTRLKGLGPKIAALLAERGIATVSDMAALDAARAAALDAQLGPFAGRMARDRWVEQARLLAVGDRAGFEAAFGRL